jgi:hypothetical protein
LGIAVTVDAPKPYPPAPLTPKQIPGTRGVTLFQGLWHRCFRALLFQGRYQEFQGAFSEKSLKGKAGNFPGQEAVPELPEPQKEADIEGLSESPALDEPEAMERWRRAIVALSEARGEERGRMEGRRSLITRQLETRFGALPEDKTSRIQSGKAEELDAWAERLLTAVSLDEVFRG